VSVVQHRAAWCERRLRAALALRERLYPGGFYRLIHAEADGLRIDDLVRRLLQSVEAS
jgi:23S rRNA G2069 N7-methylase RlmK/C1962 C5-methylase RlmI